MRSRIIAFWNKHGIEISATLFILVPFAVAPIMFFSFVIRDIPMGLFIATPALLSEIVFPSVGAGFKYLWRMRKRNVLPVVL